MIFHSFDAAILHHMFVFSIVGSIMYVIYHAFRWLHNSYSSDNIPVIAHLVFFAALCYLITEFCINVPDHPVSGNPPTLTQ